MEFKVNWRKLDEGVKTVALDTQATGSHNDLCVGSVSECDRLGVTDGSDSALALRKMGFDSP